MQGSQVYASVGANIQHNQHSPEQEAKQGNSSYWATYLPVFYLEHGFSS